jgi:phosphoesterase RecJ-like protein
MIPLGVGTEFSICSIQFPMNNLFKLLGEREAYNVVGHIRPDGDCVGSQVALCAVIQALGRRCHIIRNDIAGQNFAAFFDHMPCIPVDEIDSSLPLICVDCSDYNRVGDEVKRMCDSVFINIDHHISNTRFALHNFVRSDIASTTAILAEMLLENKFNITKQIADALYLGIMTDTGRFSYASTSLRIFKLAEILVSAGADPHKIYALVYENNTLARYRLLERLLRNIQIFCNGRVCLSFVDESDFEETGADSLDTEGFVNYMRELKGVLIGCFLEMHSDFVKCSLRAIDNSLRVDIFAGLFGGGGHQSAAGFSKFAPFGTDFVCEVRDALCKHMERFYDEYLASIE